MDTGCKWSVQSSCCAAVLAFAAVPWSMWALQSTHTMSLRRKDGCSQNVSQNYMASHRLKILWNLVWLTYSTGGMQLLKIHLHVK